MGGGKSFGKSDHLCAVPGQYTQLSTKVAGDSSLTSMSYECGLLGGKSFGKSDHLCAVPGQYTQLSTKVAGDSSLTSMSYECGLLGGKSFGKSDHLCAVECPDDSVPLLSGTERQLFTLPGLASAVFLLAFV